MAHRRRRPPSSPTSAARPSSIRRPSAVGPSPRRRSAPLESPVRFAAVSSTLCVPPLARSSPASVAPAVVCLDTAAPAPAPARRRLRLDVAALPPRRYSTHRHASTPTPRRRPCPRREGQRQRLEESVPSHSRPRRLQACNTQMREDGAGSA
ncbi:hypothetical protein PVAP13_8NG231201 [Panicum virgatum]|uniref:Uncharacterized protein n=1 Tax=Panicum virgatum TaxID=38727 RepID=A0A8T0PAN6_PANVG|nr:hypothetical protein PVAP13_8NG231201 [Panicum virgatum]